MSAPNRRTLLKSALGAAAATAGVAAFAPRPARADHHGDKKSGKPFDISLAQWSFHKALGANEFSNLEFPAETKKLGISAVEYVNRFFKNTSDEYLTELKGRCEDEGVTSVLIMVDGEGQLGAADEAERKKSVKNHEKWLKSAQALGCHSIRVNAGSSGTFTEQMERAADGLRQLCELADGYDQNVIVENHGGLSSNAGWLAGVMELCDHPRVGTLPDFGNFRINGERTFDPYKGVRILTPYAKGMSAKSYDFPEPAPSTITEGRGLKFDLVTMCKIVTDAGYHGYIGVEYEGGKLSERDGIVRTREILEAAREQLSA
ncbi:sugar phosphate isomerase/epimerase family protein [Alienimonas californiensis]|uniref:Xylose isomerase-like TIM barrel n=1 Tax=Alienimonas californiensis TaxID=2527989 RepID=A0A517P3X8_9PLAN|nr:sugar phosphate isomerase/epimerase family protein [Alienimonas californiensis]QDT14080.1 Xylose isomerase-like TIM barrel [Alienimonas californiensis]